MTRAPFVHTGNGVHPTIDLESLLVVVGDTPPHPWNITGPCDLVTWEAMRACHDITDPDGVPCDLFLWGIGASPDPRLTRVGGVPFLPANIPWPRIGRVIPTFLCQFNFTDSRDLVGDLPGDILLVFVAAEENILDGDARRMRFVWVDAGATNVIDKSDAPEPTHPFEFPRTWGVRHRSLDVPGYRRRLEDLEDPWSEDNAALWDLLVFQGTKIGGVPHHSQGSFDEPPDGYLCQLVAISATRDTPWPWVDREAPVPSSWVPGESLDIGDLGEITFYLRQDGSIEVDSACG